MNRLARGQHPWYLLHSKFQAVVKKTKNKKYINRERSYSEYFLLKRLRASIRIKNNIITFLVNRTSLVRGSFPVTRSDWQTERPDGHAVLGENSVKLSM